MKKYNFKFRKFSKITVFIFAFAKSLYWATLLIWIAFCFLLFYFYKTAENAYFEFVIYAQKLFRIRCQTYRNKILFSIYERYVVILNKKKSGSMNLNFKSTFVFFKSCWTHRPSLFAIKVCGPAYHFKGDAPDRNWDFIT